MGLSHGLAQNAMEINQPDELEQFHDLVGKEFASPDLTILYVNRCILFFVIYLRSNAIRSCLFSHVFLDLQS